MSTHSKMNMLHAYLSERLQKVWSCDRDDDINLMDDEMGFILGLVCEVGQVVSYVHLLLKGDPLQQTNKPCLNKYKLEGFLLVFFFFLTFLALYTHSHSLTAFSTVTLWILSCCHYCLAQSSLLTWSVVLFNPFNQSLQYFKLLALFCGLYMGLWLRILTNHGFW